jgi:hypothetical protein
MQKFTKKSQPLKTALVKKTASKTTFAAKLAAFILNAVNHTIRCKQQGGFSSSSTEVLGVLPLLHSNISKKDFSTVMHTSSTNIQDALQTICSSANLDMVLKKVDFKCIGQTSAAATVLVQRMIDTIETGYASRSNGKIRTQEVAAHMRWQQENDIIPASSVAWCKGVTSAKNVMPSK